MPFLLIVCPGLHISMYMYQEYWLYSWYDYLTDSYVTTVFPCSWAWVRSWLATKTLMHPQREGSGMTWDSSDQNGQCSGEEGQGEARIKKPDCSWCKDNPRRKCKHCACSVCVWGGGGGGGGGGDEWYSYVHAQSHSVTSGVLSNYCPCSHSIV